MKSVKNNTLKSSYFNLTQAKVLKIPGFDEIEEATIKSPLNWDL